MSTPNINPTDIIGLVGGLLNQGQNGQDPFGLGKVFGDIFGDPEQQGQTPATSQKPAAPNAGKVASDVFAAGSSVSDFLKDRFPRKENATSPVKEGLADLLVAMLAEHDGFENISEGKRESLYRATAEKWAEKILKQDKPAPKAPPAPSRPVAPEQPAATKVTRVTVTAEEETPVAEATGTVEPTENVQPVQEPVAPKLAPTEQAIDAAVLDTVASALHMEKHPDHPQWDICKNRNVACKYNTLGQAMVILKDPLK